MNELAIIEALRASRAQKLKEIDESEARLIEAVKASHNQMRVAIGGPDKSTPEVDAAVAPFPPVKAEEAQLA